MKNKKTIEDKLNDFLEIWDLNQIVEFLRDIMPLCELYNVEEHNDWVKNELNEDDDAVRDVRIIRTIYLISKIAEKHCAKMCQIKVKYPNLYLKMRKICNDESEPRE